MKNDPAFPGPSNTGFQKGMTMLQYAAIHAPNEIPDWFQPTPYPEKPPIRPIYADDLSKEDREMMKQWVYDPVFDLPEHLDKFGKLWEEYWSEDHNHKKAQVIHNHFQWRIFFAETLLKNINETIPKPVFDRREDKA